ncbi:N-acetyltransferase [Natronococcus pandeyae]|uniref:N-acetyltransferase n=1 Tax=Natronococcus pandeyae TaxID=2055836 RepID=A0A8J8Q7Q3_9EURY|nr:GNAT family N-acetyltransferase [Natronococcus pandeyae]TYL40228.1 N-acetyltransferase [Natronococcus pandeyae]
MEVRDAVPADAEAIREVHVRSIRGLGTDAYTTEQVDAWAAGCESADYERAIRDLEFLVAERDGAVVGFGSLAPEPPGRYEADVDAEITGLYVDPSVARQGVGSAIYDELERRARRSGVETLGLSASRNAVPFYEARGYERVREFEHEFSGEESTGVTGTVVEMEREL